MYRGKKNRTKQCVVAQTVAVILSGQVHCFRQLIKQKREH